MNIGSNNNFSTLKLFLDSADYPMRWLVVDGKFGAYMQVNIQNDGPVTITLESPAHNQVGHTAT